ncbi:MAG: hypothetical protein HY400_03920 [Elusimicrobia bacterium]|nr:hypothetical protein [Elusimicrobiota bacterium]
MILPILSSILLSLHLPPFHLHEFLWVGWVPLFLGADRCLSWRQAALSGLFFGVCYYALVFRWVAAYSLTLFLLVLFLAVLFSVYFTLGIYFSLKMPFIAMLLLIPFIWTVPVFIAGGPLLPFLGSSSLLVGLHTALPLPFLQLAHILTEPGLVFFVLVINVGLFEVLRRVWGGQKRFAVGILGGVFLILGGTWFWGVGQIRAYSEEKPSFTLACAQHNLPFSWEWRWQHAAELFKTYEDMAIEAGRNGARFILFPQYKLPEDVYRNPERIAGIAKKAKATIALGTYTPENPKIFGKESWVISLVFSPEGKLVGEHRALHPNPFGRPLVLRGEKAEPIAIPSIGKIAVLPCYDDVHSYPARRFLSSRPDFIASIANDGVFEGTTLPELHLNRDVYRAVESRKYLVRCAATGISAVVDPLGRVKKMLASGRGVLYFDLPLGPRIK